MRLEKAGIALLAHHAVAGERLVVEPVARGPGPAMHVDESRKWAAADRPVEPRQQRRPVSPLVFEVAHLDLEPLLDRDFVRHRRPPAFPPSACPRAAPDPSG